MVYILLDMKKRLAIAFTVGSILMILDSLDAGQALMMFIFTGTLPGTNLSLSPTIMMIIMLSAAIVCSKLFIAQPIKQRIAEIEKSQKSQNSKKLKHA